MSRGSGDYCLVPMHPKEAKRRVLNAQRTIICFIMCQSSSPKNASLGHC